MKTFQLQSLKLHFSFLKDDVIIPSPLYQEAETTQTDTFLKAKITYFENGEQQTQLFAISNEHHKVGKTRNRGIIYCLTTLFDYFGKQHYLLPPFSKDLEVNDEYARLLLTNLKNYENMGFKNTMTNFSNFGVMSHRYHFPYTEPAKQLFTVLKQTQGNQVGEWLKNIIFNADMVLEEQETIKLEISNQEIESSSQNYLAHHKKLSDVKTMLEEEQDIQLIVLSETADVSIQDTSINHLGSEWKSNGCYDLQTIHLVNREYHYSEMLDSIKESAKAKGKHYKKVIYLPLPEQEQHPVNIIKFCIEFLEWLKETPKIRVVVYTKHADVVTGLKYISDKLGINYTNVLITNKKDNKLRQSYKQIDLIIKELNKSLNVLSDYVGKIS